VIWQRSIVGGTIEKSDLCGQPLEPREKDNQLMTFDHFLLRLDPAQGILRKMLKPALKNPVQSGATMTICL
jgi:hypothetical protein